MIMARFSGVQAAILVAFATQMPLAGITRSFFVGALLAFYLLFPDWHLSPQFP